MAEVPSDQRFRIEFTDILYGTVIGTSFGRVLSLDIDTTTAMFAFALLLVVDDWVLYHVALHDIRRTARNYVLTLLFDTLVLLSWFYLTLVPSSRPALFFGLVAVFFSLASIWELLLRFTGWKSSLANVELAPILVFSLLAIAAWLLPNVDMRVLLGIGAVSFILIRFRVWRSLLSKESLPI